MPAPFLEWKPLPLVNGEVADYKGFRVAVIRRRAKEWHAFVGNKRLPDAETKRAAIKLILEEIDIQPKLF